jgi:hypothetical protein
MLTSVILPAVADADVVTAATTAGTAIKDTAIGVITALIPFGVAVFLLKKALPWAKSMVR